MKRTSKILVLVLSLALILGAVATVISATASDITNKKKADFESSTVGAMTGNFGGINFEKKTYSSGLEFVQGADGNKYALITKLDPYDKAAGTPYIYVTGSRASVSNGDIKLGNDDIKNYKFMKLSLDITSPTGKFIRANINPYFHYLQATTKDGVDTHTDNFWQSSVKDLLIDSDSTGSFISQGSDKLYLNPYEFTRIEIIYENVSPVDEETGKYTPTLKTSIYVNGELWVSKEAGSSNATKMENYYKSTPAVSFYRPQIEFALQDTNNYKSGATPTVYTEIGDSLGIDNFSIDVVKAGSTLVAADLVTYKAENMPVGTYVAEFDGVKYDSVEKAIAAAPAGATVKLLKDGISATVSKVINIEGGEFTANLKAGTGYQIISADGYYKVTYVSGIKTTVTDNFDSLVGKSALDSSNPSGTKHSWSLTGRWGKIDKIAQDDGNNYLRYTNTAWKKNSAPYFGTGYGGSGTTKRPTIANAGTVDEPVAGALQADGSIDKNPYLVYDIDIASDTGAFAFLSIGLQSRYATGANMVVKDAGTEKETKTWTTNLDAGNHGEGNTPVCFLSDSNGSYYYTKSDQSDKVYINPYEFTHVTVVWEGVLTETNASYRTHLYINGKYVKTFAEKTNTGFYERPHLTWDEIRVGLGTNNTAQANDGKTTVVDNATARVISNAYTGNLADVLASKADITAWDGNIYDEKFVPADFDVAAIGDVKYTSLEAAIEAAQAGDTITLLKPAPLQITVDKLISIDAGENKVDLVPAAGINMKQEGNVYSFVELIVASIGDVQYKDLQVALDAVRDGETIKLLDNVATTVYVNKVLSNVTIDKGEFTATIEAGEGIKLTVEENVYNSVERVKNFEYVVDGKTVYAYDNEKTLKDVITAADKSSTLKLHADVTIIQANNTSYIDISKKLTLDLNGYTIKAILEGTKAKCYLFRMTGGTDLTVTSSRKGGKIFNEGWNNTTAVGAAGVFAWPNDSAILRINGNGPDGTPYLAIYSGNIIQGYSNAAEYYIDGGMYVTVAGDQQGTFDVRKAGRDAEVKNAILYTTSGNGVFGYGGAKNALDDYGHITVDNCVVVGDITGSGFVAPQSMTVTNTYITGKVNLNLNGSYKFTETAWVDGVATRTENSKDNFVGTITLGVGTYVGGTIAEGVKIADGYKLYDVNVTKDLSYDTHKWKASANYTFDASSFDVTTETKEYTFKKLVAGEAIKATWKDAEGNVLGTSTVYTGAEAVAPTDLKPSEVIAEGWLGYVPAEWNESLLVPADATEITFTAKADGAKKIVVSVQLLFNIKLTTHFEYHLYIPEVVEGITVTGVDFRGDRLSRYKGFLGTKYTFNGAKYTMVDAWPGFKNAVAENSTAGVTFTYDGVTYTVAANVNMVKYCEYVLDAGNGYGDAAKALVANAANYIVTGNKILKTTGDGMTKLEAIVANSENLIKIPEAEKVVPDTSAISKYVSGVQLISDAYGPRFRFTLTEEGKAAKISLTKTSATSGTDTEYATLGYIDTNNTHISNVNNTVIEVTPAEGEKISLTFDLGNYYAALAATGATAEQLAFIDAMYGYAIAGENY